MAKQRASANKQCRSAADVPGCAHKVKTVEKYSTKFLRTPDFKFAFSPEEERIEFLLPAICNFLALIITKCGSICLCMCAGCQQH